MYIDNYSVIANNTVTKVMTLPLSYYHGYSAVVVGFTCTELVEVLSRLLLWLYHNKNGECSDYYKFNYS